MTESKKDQQHKDLTKEVANPEKSGPSEKVGCETTMGHETNHSTWNETQTTHKIGDSASNLLTPSASALGIVDNAEGTILTGKGLLPLVDEDLSETFKIELGKITPASSKADLQESLAIATKAYFEQKGWVSPEELAKTVVINPLDEAGTFTALAPRAVEFARGLEEPQVSGAEESEKVLLAAETHSKVEVKSTPYYCGETLEIYAKEMSGRCVKQNESLVAISRERLGPTASDRDVATYAKEIATVNGITQANHTFTAETTIDLPGHRPGQKGFFLEDEHGGLHHFYKAANGSFVEEYQRTPFSTGREKIEITTDNKIFVADQTHPRHELSKEQIESSLRIQKLLLEQAAIDSIHNRQEFLQFQSDMSTFSRRYDSLHLKGDRTDAEIAKTFLQVRRLLEAKTDRLPTDTKPDYFRQEPGESNWRTKIAEQVMHHAADPTTIDQGQSPTCRFDSLQTRLYIRDPAESARLVSDMVLTGKYVSTDKSATVEFDHGFSFNLCPTADARDYRINKDATDASRSFASQIFDVTAINVAFRKDRSVYSYEMRDPNSPDLRRHTADLARINLPLAEQIARNQMLAWDSNPLMQPQFGSLIDVNEAVAGRREVGFLISPANLGPTNTELTRDELKYSDLFFIDNGLRSIQNGHELAAELQRVRASGQWPPIVDVGAGQGPFGAAAVRIGGGVADPTAPHTAVIIDATPDCSRVNIDMTWGKAADDINAIPAIPANDVGEAIMHAQRGHVTLGVLQWANGFATGNAAHPADWLSLKRGWFQDLPNWHHTHPGDPNYSQWFAQHPDDWIFRKWLQEHPSDSSRLIRWRQAVRLWLDRYPEERTGVI